MALCERENRFVILPLILMAKTGLLFSPETSLRSPGLYFKMSVFYFFAGVGNGGGVISVSPS